MFAALNKLIAVKGQGVIAKRFAYGVEDGVLVEPQSIPDYLRELYATDFE